MSLLVGKSMSGAFLAHGYQANRIIALKDSGVMVHAMGKESAARVTLRSVDELEQLVSTFHQWLMTLKVMPRLVCYLNCYLLKTLNNRKR